MTVTDERWLGKMAHPGERPQAWQDRAACKDAVVYGLVKADADPWFPKGDRALAAKALAFCRQCSVLLECERERRAVGAGVGVWAGRNHEPKTIVRSAPNTTPAGAERYALWEQGLNDRQIADRMGIQPATVTNWRRYHKLTGNVGCGDMGKREELHAQGFCDREIAEIEGTKRSIIAAWRVRNNLPINLDPNGAIPVSPYKSKVNRGTNAERGATRSQRYREGWTDQEMATAEGIPKGAIKSWRQRRGDPANKAAS